MHRRTLLLAAAAAVAFAAPAFAQSQDESARVDELVVTIGSQVELPPVYSGGQVARGGRVGMFGALDVMDTPFATTSYTEEVIRLQQARSVADVLQNDPAVRVAKGFGNFQELYVIRGFPVYSDDMTYNGLYGVLPRQFVAAEFLERVEVFHGASAFLNGAAPGGSGVGGAFNLVPKRAPDTDLNRVTAGFESQGAGYGALDFARRFGASKEFGVRLNAARRDGETSVDNQDRKLTALSAGLDYRGERFRLSADLGYQNQHIDQPRPSVTPAGAIPTPPDAKTNFGQPWTYTDEEQLFGVARAEFDVSDAVSVWAAFGGRDGQEANVLANPTAQPNGVTSAYRFDNAREDRVLSGDAGIRADIATGAVEHRLVASASFTDLKSKNAYAFSSFAGFAGNLYAPVAVTPPIPNFFIGGVLADPLVTERSKYSSAAIADMLTFLDGRLIATVGGRWQKIDVSAYNYNTGLRASNYEASAFTPVGALVFKPSGAVSIYGNYSEALVPGQIAPAVSGGLSVINAGQILEPFRSKQYEVGAKLDTGRFGGTVSLFSTSLPSAFVQNGVFAANGKQRNQGLEVSAFGQPVEGVRVIGGFTVLDTELVRTAGGLSDGKHAIGAPKFTANLNVEWDIPAIEGVTVEGRMIHTGSQYANIANTVKLGDSTRFDLGARYTTPIGGQPVTLRARVENVAGKDYWASVGGYPGANYLVLAPARTFLLSAAVEF